MFELMTQKFVHKSHSGMQPGKFILPGLSNWINCIINTTQNGLALLRTSRRPSVWLGGFKQMKAMSKTSESLCTWQQSFECAPLFMCTDTHMQTQTSPVHLFIEYWMFTQCCCLYIQVTCCLVIFFLKLLLKNMMAVMLFALWCCFIACVCKEPTLCLRSNIIHHFQW